MTRLFRPFTPLSIQLAVILRQLGDDAVMVARKVKTATDNRMLQKERDSNLVILANMLAVPVIDLELHHRPSLVNRMWSERNLDYDPPANAPAHLFYLPHGDHDVETRIRGQHGQHSDLGMVRKNKRIAKNRDPKRRKTKIPNPENYKWPSRPFNRRKR